MIGRSKQYAWLDLPEVQTRLQSAPDAQVTHPESGTVRDLYDCLAVPLTPTGPVVRLLVATHPTGAHKPAIGVVSKETVYELFYTTLPPHAFTASDVLQVYLHRGSFETVLSDEDQEQDPDRWVSRSASGQDCWQILSQWIWNLRLELGQHLSPTAMRLMEFAPAQSVEPAAVVEPVAVVESTAVVGSAAVVESISYGPPQWAHRSFTKGFAGSDFVLQPDGTLRCPADHPLTLQERRPERNGSVRMVYGARACHCRPCSLRDQCQEATTTKKPASGSVPLFGPPHPPHLLRPRLHRQQAPLMLREPLPSPAESAPFPVLWGDWPRCPIRRRWFQLLRSQTVILPSERIHPEKKQDSIVPERQTRAQRAHWRLSWDERLARNTCPSTDTFLKVTIHGLPATFATLFGLDVVTTA